MSAGQTPFQPGPGDRCPASSLTPRCATVLFSTDLNLTSPGAEKHISDFSEQISEIIPLHLLPAEHSRSSSLHHVERDQVLMPHTLLIGHQIHRRACCLSV